jgi:hypothetical protein
LPATEAGNPLDQVINILKRYMSEDQSPLLADFPVDGVLLDALQEVFACPPGKR